MLNHLSNNLRRVGAVAAMTVALALAAPAHAARYVGSWDPAFGPPFTDLGWRGQATFFVPDACLALSGVVLNSNNCSNFSMQLVSAEVGFYRLSDPTDAAFHETLPFATSSPLVFSMTIDNGTLAGVVGSFGYFVPSDLSIAGGPNSEFALLFQEDLARMAFSYDPPGECVHDGHGYLGRNDDAHDDCKIFGFSQLQAPDGSRPFITFRIATVPEPGSLALALLAMALFGVQYRRRASQ